MWPKLSWHPGLKKRRLRINLGRRRYMQDGATIHGSVADLLERGYAPSNLPGEVRVVCSCGNVFTDIAAFRARTCRCRGQPSPGVA
jgi:hypothetical protein